MGFLGGGLGHFFTRKRHRINAAPIHFVQADVLIPGAESFAPLPTHADPEQYKISNYLTAFTPLRAWQPGLVNQGLALVDAPVQGFPYDGIVTQDLIDPNNYPNVYPGINDVGGQF
jgi:hypothetical protein